ncbi:MAG: hypothetical protein WBD58_22905 [Geitlerinemataceae cyanobacterium]
MNKLEAQAWLYIGILERLGANQAESHERIAKTIEALKHKKAEIAEELDPRKPEKYKTINKLQNFFESITSTQEKKDFVQIENILNDLIWITQNSQPSDNIIPDILDRLSIVTSQKADRITPVRLGLVYRLSNLLSSIYEKEIHRLDKSEIEQLHEIQLNEVKFQRDLFYKEYKRLLNLQYENQQEIEEYTRKLDDINQLITNRESEIARLNALLEQLTQTSQGQQSQILSLNRKLNAANINLEKLHNEKNALSEQITQLSQSNSQKQDRINQLDRELRKYSNIRVIEGSFIGNLGNRNSRYHFNQKCRDWKMLTLEYMLRLEDPNEKRDIRTSKNSSVFRMKGLEECQICSKQ